MLDFYIVSNCPGNGLFRNGKKAKREYQKYPEAKIQKFQSPADIAAAQTYCDENNISVKMEEWEDLFTAGRMSEFAQKGSLDAVTFPQINKKDNQKKEKATVLPLDADVVIYTDGSYMERETKKGKKRSFGGYAAVIILRNMYDAEIMVSGHVENATDSHSMEMVAIAKALSRLGKYNVDGGKVTLFCDAQSLVTEYNKKLAGWAECGWKKADGQYIKRWKLWRKIWRKAQDFTLRVYWVKGHAKNKYNNRCHLTACAESLLRTDKKHAMTEKT